MTSPVLRIILRDMKDLVWFLRLELEYAVETRRILRYIPFI